ncbi:MAG: nucleotidyltransferase family protein [Magnetococcales bacterium]|nr:nucleotidyltransferase family protein [Magnetococcales bacterium]
MNGFILAAGRGERLRPLTDHTPKPLIEIDGHPVIDHTLERLRRLPIRRIIVNVWHLADLLADHLTRHPFWGDRIDISRETELLETGGGVCNALPLLGHEPCLAINGDILWEFDLAPLIEHFAPSRMDALLLLVANPEGKGGDFVFSSEKPEVIASPAGGPWGNIRRREGDAPGWTYSGIQVFNPRALELYPVTRFSLNRFFDDALRRERLFGIFPPGRWSDIGTPQTLARARDEWKFPLQIRAG